MDETSKNYDAQTAAEIYLSRYNRNSNPEGDFDKAGRWYPSNEESQKCCTKISSPTRNHPYSLMVHCRTLKHVSHLTGISESEIKAAMITVKVLRRLEGEKISPGLFLLKCKYRNIGSRSPIKESSPGLFLLKCWPGC